MNRNATVLWTALKLEAMHLCMALSGLLVIMAAAKMLGWPLHRYGLEQQAEIVRHYWLLTQGVTIGGAPGVEAYRAILPHEWKAAA